MKFFTGDQHFNHKTIIEACERPFKNVWAMNAYMIDQWNKVVEKGDVVYHLGDFALPNKGDGMEVKEIVEQLHGQIHLIKGNHDDKNLKLFKNLFVKIVSLEYIKIDYINKKQRSRQKIMLCHYPMLSWRTSHHGSWHLHGHVHGRMAIRRGCLDIGVDATNFIPISEEEIPHLIWE